MSHSLVHAAAILAVLVALFAFGHLVRDRSFSNPLFYAVAALEALLLVIVVTGIAAAIGTDRSIRFAMFFSYLIAMFVIPPAAVVWGVAEKSRWGTGAVAVALLAVAVLCERILQIWTN